MTGLGFGNSNSGWNYSDPNKDNYMPQITGTLVEISETQKVNFQTRQKECWPEGNPKLNMKFVVKDDNGNEYPWVFQPKNSKAADTVAAVMEANGLDPRNLNNILGLMVSISTNNDSVYGAQNPRPWFFQILGPGTQPARGCFRFRDTPEGKEFYADRNATTQPVQQQTPPPMNGQFYAAPTASQQQPVMQQPMMQQPMNNMMNQVVQQQPFPMQQMQQQTAQPMQNQSVQMPQIVQPAVQQQQPMMHQQTMQQPIQQGGIADIYDDDIPF